MNRPARAGYKPRLLQDFPLRGKPVFLELHRRRWRNKQDKKDIHRDFTILAEGTKFTKELSDPARAESAY